MEMRGRGGDGKHPPPCASAISAPTIRRNELFQKMKFEKEEDLIVLCEVESEGGEEFPCLLPQSLSLSRSLSHPG